MNLTSADDLLLTNCPPPRSIAQLAAYATSLCLGSNHLCRSLKATTIEKYLLAISKYLTPLNSDNRDPRMEQSGETRISPLLKAIIAKQRRWESSPNQREPFLPELTRHLHTLIKHTDAHADGILCALSDWFIIGHYTGFRRSEAFQNPTNYLPSDPALHDDDRPLAFLPEDLSFHRPIKRRITLSEACSLSPRNLESATLQWRHQKNGKKNEKKSLALLMCSME